MGDIDILIIDKKTGMIIAAEVYHGTTPIFIDKHLNKYLNVNIQIWKRGRFSNVEIKDIVKEKALLLYIQNKRRCC